MVKACCLNEFIAIVAESLDSLNPLKVDFLRETAEVNSDCTCVPTWVESSIRKVNCWWIGTRLA